MSLIENEKLKNENEELRKTINGFIIAAKKMNLSNLARTIQDDLNSLTK